MIQDPVIDALSTLWGSLNPTESNRKRYAEECLKSNLKRNIRVLQWHSGALKT